MVMLKKLVTNIVATGTSTLHLFDSANVPDRLDGAIGVPGYVKASTTGRTVCMPKYTGNIFC